MKRIQNYIGGELLSPRSGEYLKNFAPALGKAYSEVPNSGVDDVAAAVAAAERAFPAWSAMHSEKRSRILHQIARVLEARLEEFAVAESHDSGKPLHVAREIDIPRSVRNLDFFAGAAVHFASESHATGGEAINYTLRAPLGVVSCVSPWNLPLYLFTWKIAPALAAGCCVVAKPSEITPMTAYLFSQACIEAGLPPGVLNIIHGEGARTGSLLVSHPGIRAVSFTGSTRTGAEIARVAAPQFKKISLEMGGKNPAVVFADCDFKKAVEQTARSVFSNQGQICLCTPRIYVEKSIYARFRKALVEKARTLKIGDPANPKTDQGAVVSRAHFEKIMSYIQLAKKEGGTLLTGGKRARVGGKCEKGWFIQPTLFEGLRSDARVNQEEIFGPVAALIPFTSESEVLAQANGTNYGLAATIWTRDLARAHRFAAQLHSGIVWVNCWMLRDLRTPFGGAKDSGVGSEGGWEAMRFFTEPKNVCVKIDGESRA